MLISLTNPYIDRDFRNDLPEETPAQRYGRLVLPFICLYQPAGKVVSCTMNVLRLAGTVKECISGEGDHSLLLDLALSVSSVAGSFFHFRAAMLFSTGADIMMSLRRCERHLSQKEYLQLQKEVLHTISHILYLAMLSRGGIELTIASLALKSLQSFIEAVEEGQKDGHGIDAFAKGLLGAVRAYQAYGCNQIRIERNKEAQLQREKEILAKAEKAAAEKIRQLQKKHSDEKKALLEEARGEMQLKLQDLHRKHIQEVEQLQAKVQKKSCEAGVSELERVERKRYLSSLSAYETLLKVVTQGEEDAFFGENHPLVDIQKAIAEREVVFVDDYGDTINAGAYFSRMGGGLVDGMNLHFRKTKDSIELHFRLTHAGHRELQQNLEALKFRFRDWETSSNDYKEFLQTDNISFSKQAKFVGDKWEKFELNGATIAFCLDKTYLDSHKRVQVTIPVDGTIYDGHRILSLFGLEKALKISSKEEMEIMKLMHLFHMFEPLKEFGFVRHMYTDEDPHFVRQQIENWCPSMKKRFETYLHRTSLKEISSGQERCFVDGLVEDLQQKLFDVQHTLRAFGKTQEGWEVLPEIFSMSKKEQIEKMVNLRGTVTLSSVYNIEQAGAKISMIMKLGLLSEEQRKIINSCQYDGKGGNNDKDGSCNSVYVQMLTANMDPKDSSYGLNSFSNRVRLELDPDFLGFGTFQYHSDRYGRKSSKIPEYLFNLNLYNYLYLYFTEETYLSRDNIEKFLQKEFLHPRGDHELMSRGFYLLDVFAPL